MTNNLDNELENDRILRLIDCLHKEIHHNTTLVWQGVNRSLILFGAAIAGCSFLIKDIGIDNKGFTLIMCIIISALSMIGNRLLIFSITRNIEHGYQYNKAINCLEAILKDRFEEAKWIKYLLNSVYDSALKGTIAQKHNKQVARTFPWTFWVLSFIGVIAFVARFYIIISDDTFRTYVIGICIGIILASCVTCVTPKIQSIVALKYKDETKEWDKNFEKIDCDKNKKA